MFWGCLMKKNNDISSGIKKINLTLLLLIVVIGGVTIIVLMSGIFKLSIEAETTIEMGEKELDNEIQEIDETNTEAIIENYMFLYEFKIEDFEVQKSILEGNR